LKQLLEQQWSARGARGIERARILQPSRGFSYTWLANNALGDRILAESMRLDCRTIKPKQNYRIKGNKFITDRRRRRLSCPEGCDRSRRRSGRRRRADRVPARRVDGTAAGSGSHSSHLSPLGLCDSRDAIIAPPSHKAHPCAARVSARAPANPPTHRPW
jgi:hypothetical protein